MTWGKIMLEQQQKPAGFVCLGGCLGMLAGAVLAVIGNAIQVGILGALGIPC